MKYSQSDVCVCMRERQKQREALIYIYAHIDIDDSVLDLGKTSTFNLEISFYAFMGIMSTVRKCLPVYSIKNRKEQTVA